MKLCKREKLIQLGYGNDAKFFCVFLAKCLVKVFLSSFVYSSDVFKLCHAVDPTEIPSSGGGPNGPRRTGFNLSWLGQNMSY